MRSTTRLLAVAALGVSLLGVAPGSASANLGPDLDCKDFTYREDAAEHLLAFPGDPDGLDRDGDGKACEWLPSRPVVQPPAGLAQAPVWRFWSPGFNNAHFFTTNAAESEQIKAADRNWRYEGQAFRAFAPVGQDCPGAVAVHRFYSARFQSHFFTADQAEAEHVRTSDPNWTYEGVAYCATTTKVVGSTALYRFWSPRFGKHFFTANASEAAQLRSNDANWDYEGIAYYVLP